MRIRYLAATAALLAIASPAFAQSTPVSFSPEFQQALEEDLGAREGEVLRAAVIDAIDAEFARRGASTPSGITVTIVDAAPNRPTMQQLRDQPGLDSVRSISIGGAELRATLPNGEVVTHRRYNHSLSDLSGAASTWTEAHRAIRRFAVKVADAYASR
ncbi:MAG: hypothetical protein A4S17_02220 [Proteobacteria bacterium HN_bin10]|jgi:hypothetical protein|nr:MAG: hypothetical protein A4S17_02220 [Proteobacteria bacterium HN_bin10]